VHVVYVDMNNVLSGWGKEAQEDADDDVRFDSIGDRR